MPQKPFPGWDSCQATAFGTFGDEFQRAAEYSEAGLAPLGSIIEELVAQPVATLATRHLQNKGRGWHQPGFPRTRGEKQARGLFRHRGCCFVVLFLWFCSMGIRTFKAPGRSSRLATLSPRRVSVNAGHGDECSYLARLENSSWPHLAHT